MRLSQSIPQYKNRTVVLPQTQVTKLVKPSRVAKSKLSGLTHFQKTLLITDGTVTELLEYYLNESILAQKVYEEIERDVSALPSDHQTLVNQQDTKLMLRKVRLEGQSSLKNWIFAESTILVENLKPSFRDELLSTTTPIGHLWFKHRLETFKSDYSIYREVANKEVADILGVDVDSEILSRTYCVYSDSKLVMIITEKFSKDNFLE